MYYLIQFEPMSQRPGTTAAVKLFGSDNIAYWKRALAKYNAAVELTGKQKSKPELVRLDDWLWNQLPGDVRSRSPAHLTHSELSDLMRWKLIRGKFRPLQGLVDSNSAASVVSATTKAMKCLDQGQWKAGLKELCALKGIGVATASAIAALFSPETCAFMADEVIETTCPRRDYTLPVYCVLQEGLMVKDRRLKSLRDSSVDVGGSGGGKRKNISDADPEACLTCEDLGKALWAVAVLSVQAPDIYGSVVADSTGSEPAAQTQPQPQATGRKKQKV